MKKMSGQSDEKNNEIKVDFNETKGILNERHNDIKSNIDSVFDDLIESLKQRQNELKNEIDIKTRKMLNELKTMNNKNSNSLSDINTLINNNIIMFECDINECKNAINKFGKVSMVKVINPPKLNILHISMNEIQFNIINDNCKDHVNIIEVESKINSYKKVIKTQNNNIVLPKLTKNTKYHIRCKTTNIVNNSSSIYSNIMEIKTLKYPDLNLRKNERCELKSDILHKFGNIFINEGSILTSNDFNGKKGGKLLLYVEYKLHIKFSGKITMTGKGYMGGDTSRHGGKKGKGPGGGSPSTDKSKCGGAGSYGTKGNNAGGNAGKLYGTNKMEILYHGSGGGGGYLNNVGGTGGGIIKIIGNIIEIENKAGIYCNGGFTRGGGGSGGSIYIICNTLNLNGRILSKGGISKNNDNKIQCRGGYGRIRIDYSVLNNHGKIIPDIGYSQIIQSIPSL